MTFTRPATKLFQGDYHGTNCVITGIDAKTRCGAIYKVVTPSFPDITRAWYHEIIETKNCIAALSFPGDLGNLPELMCVRADTDLGDAFTAQVVRSRDYVSCSRDLVAPGVNLEAGDTVQMPLDFGDALQAMLQQTDMNESSFLADPDELGF